MPTISAFYGILIRMFFNDHAPPHFHARYGDFEATIDLSTLEVSQGQLPRRALSLVQEWAIIHREELRQRSTRYLEWNILMYWDVVEVKPQPGYRLFIRFKDGLAGPVQ